jgi:outer membrane protein OmpA-like peptidoglycan-associated protein
MNLRRETAVAMASAAATLYALAAMAAPIAVPPAPRIEPGLVVVTASNDKVINKDYESVLSVLSVEAAGVRYQTEWTMPDPQAPEGVHKQRAISMVRAEDAETARRLLLWYLPGDPETIPGSTGPTPSVQLFDELMRTGEAKVVIGAVSQADGGLLGGLMTGRKWFRGTVKRMADDKLRVLVNGKPAVFDTVHVGGMVSVAGDSGNVEFWWIKDPASRMALKIRFQDSLSQVVKIDRPVEWRPEGAASSESLEEGLRGKACRSEVPGIYFLTDSAQLLSASQPAIERIAATLKAHPDWNVTIEGHTDSTGSDAHNLDLSRRRAAALKTELVAKHGIAETRLQTAGFGRTRPVDTNDTLDGRAHNRRVEIVRRC